ncbi:MAG: hypothetical protein ACOC2N_00005, partial [Spirochaetota bacterium]
IGVRQPVGFALTPVAIRVNHSYSIPVALITKAELARRAGVTKAAITKVTRSGTVPLRPDGKIDDANPVVVAYITKHRETSKSGSRTGSVRKPPKGRPARKATQAKPRIHVADDDPNEAHDNPHGNYETNTLLQIQKVRAEIDYKREQEAHYKQRRLKDNGTLIPRQDVRQKIMVLAQDLRMRLLDMPRRISANLVDRVKAGSTEHEIEQYLAGQIADAIRHAKETAKHVELGDLFDGS